MDSFELHRATPQTSLEDYVHSHHMLLGQKVESKTRIYLDTNFWLWLRDAHLGRSEKQGGPELLEILTTLVAKGDIICPLSYPTFTELMRQTDLGTRMATAKVIDELSSGICIVEPEHLVKNEIGFFIYHLNEGQQPTIPIHRTWTKVTAVLGINIPELSWKNPEELVVQKAYFDHVSKMSLSDMLSYLSDTKWPQLASESLCQKINLGNRTHSKLIKSFNQALQHEIEGVVDIYAELIDEVLVAMAHSSGIEDDRTPEQYRETQNVQRNLFSIALKKREVARRALPSFYIPAGLHASMRWDKQRNFKANDFVDFMHAELALPYCHAFFTEKPLSELITNGNVKLDKFYNCHVAFNIKSAINFLKPMLMK